MKTQTILCTIALIALLAVSSNALASTTYANAYIFKSGHNSATDSDSDSALGSCSSQAHASCPLPGDASWAQTNAVVTVTNTSPGILIGESVTYNNNDVPQPVHTITNSGGAKFASINARLIGSGLLASAQLYVQGLELTIGAGSIQDFKMADMELTVSLAPVYAGNFTLYGDGSSTGTGIYSDPADFDVSLLGDTWIATYTGPASLPFQMPVGSDFELDFDTELQGFVETGSQAGVATTGIHDLAIGLDGAYNFIVPEPCSAALMLLGLGAVVRRRRKRLG